ncbi:MAG: hypothetical protein OXH45_00360 [Gammaproteobacteria bacterium]|nr:hypothetical protein [Gammaproteobacteria bacterium]
MKIIAVALLTCSVFTTLAAAERNAYLIASEPYDDSSFGFPTLLYRVEDHRLVKVRTVTTQQQNTIFVDVYPDKGYALVGSDRRPGLGSLLLDVINMNSVSKQKSYDIDICENCAYISGHMHGKHDAPVYIFRGYNEHSQYRGVDLTTGQILSDFDWTDEAGAYRTGTGSPFTDRSKSFRRVAHDSDWLIYGESESPRRYSMGWEQPQGYGWVAGSIITALLVNNDDIRLVLVYRHDNWKAELRGLGLHLFDKAAGKWFKPDIPSGMESFRAFRHWLVWEDVKPYEPGALDLERLEQQCFPPFLSAAINLSLVREIAPTGSLRFYNARAKELIVHDTSEPNSEVLYVDEDDVAWFRVSDELRRARIENGKLGPATVVVKAPELWAVHWLFFGEE